MPTLVAGNSLSIGGSISAAGLAAIGEQPVSANVIGTQGLRIPIEQFALDRGSGEININVDLDLLISDPAASLPIRIPLLGRALDLMQIQSRDRLGSAGLVRLELQTPVDLAAKQISGYGQVLFSVDQVAATGTAPSVVLSSDQEIQLAATSILSVEVVDAEGQAVPGALVTVLPYSGVSPATLTEQPNLAPAFVATDSAGQAVVHPLPEPSDSTLAQVFAYAEGYCPALSQPTTTIDLLATEQQLVLNACADLNADSGVPNVSVAFGDDIATKDFQDSKIGYSKSGTIPLEFSFSSLELRALRIRAYEGLEGSGEAVAELQLLYPTPQIDFSLPALFADGTPNGAFTLEITLEDLAADRLTSTPIAGTTQLLYGRRSTENPEFDASTLVIVGGGQTNGVVSGRSGEQFSLSSGDCSDDERLGLIVAPQSSSSNPDLAVYADCVSGATTFLAEDVFDQDSELGGQVDIHVFKEDIFGNRSVDDPVNGANVIQVYVDYGQADPSSQAIALGSAIGVAPSDATVGTDDDPYVFGINNQIDVTNLGAYALRFASPSQCRHDSPSLADGSDIDSLGAQIGQFALESATVAATFVSCGDDLNLGNAALTVPNDPSEDLVLSVLVKDAAGNAGLAAFSYTIESCDSVTSPYLYCWTQ